MLATRRRQIQIDVLRGYFRPGPELSLANFPGSEFFGEGFFVAVAEGVQVGVEFGGVVKMFEVGEFVEHYVLAQVWGEEHQADVQVYVSFC